jgi:hypothetical protein
LVAANSPGGPANVGGTFAGGTYDSQVATVTGNTPGSFTYAFTAPVNNWAVSDLDAGSQHYNSSFTYTNAAPYTFAVSSANATAGATYTNNGNTFTVVSTISSGTILQVSGTGVPTASGTLTKSSGTGDSTITFSSYTGSNWISFAGPSKNIAGNALAYTGNTLNVLYDSVTVGMNGSNQLYVPNGGISNTQINGSAAIAFSKLASLSSANILLGSAGNVATATAVSGDISISNSGVTSLVAISNATLTTLSALTSASSLATVGTITSGTWHGSAIGIAYGGTGQTTQTAAFDALSPLTTAGDTLYYNGTHNVRLGIGSSGQVLTVVAGEPSWAAPAVSPGSISLTQNHILVGNASNVAADVAMSGDVAIVASGATTIQAGAVTAAKLGSVTDGTTLDQSGAGSTIEIKSGGVGTTQLAANAVTAAKIATSSFDQVTITGGNGTAAAVSYSPSVKTSAQYGGAATLSANTTYVMRWGIPANSETAGRLYVADWNTISYDLFWVVGLYNSTSTTTTGTTITIVTTGSFTLGSSDTTFGSTDQGKPAWLGSSGAYIANSSFSPSSGDANVKLGIVTGSTTIWVAPQVMGVS